MVTVDSPRSPRRIESFDTRVTSLPLTPQSTSDSPTRHSHSRTLSRVATPALEARMSVFEQNREPPKTDLASKPKPPVASPDSSAVTKVPPPVNRTAKPSIPNKPSSLAQKTTNLTAPEPSTAELTDTSASPFSTPPSSKSSSPTRRKDSFSHQSQRHSRHQSAHGISMTGDLADERPRLPARPDLQIRSGRTSPTKPRSGMASPSKLSHSVLAQRPYDGMKRASTTDDLEAHRPPPTKASIPRASALGLGFDRAVLPSKMAPPVVPAPRRSTDMRRPQIQLPAQTNGQSHDAFEHQPTPVEQSHGPSASLAYFPDSSQANRRPPRYKYRPYHIATDYDTRLFAVCGEYVATTGYMTKAWSLRTGEQILNMTHHENVKATALIFKPPTTTEDEGKRLWLGTNIGEIHEVDIPSQTLVKTKANAHVRREIIRMYRHGSELWSLDDGGDLCVWRPDHKGKPSLDSQFDSFRIPRGHSFSIVCGKHLWIAFGRELRVFNPGTRSDADFQVLHNPLSQPSTGEITSGSMLPTKPDLVYFGHSDGKVSIYNHHDYTCLGVITVSVYKLSSLVGVGQYLWAGFYTGMVYVYDTSTTPWRVMKDWEAHEKKQVCGLVADPSALWKMDRLHVVTLGTDNMIRVWDGLLEEDWLDSRMQEHDSDYCSFREITASVLTWNAGASKPSYLQQDKMDNNFFREYLTARHEPPDIFVFGFQELVDLEDKKTTAKAFFKSKKKMDGSEQEHMSHQYRAWRDHLTRCLDEYMPVDEPYALLHTASMVGLFTCIFVKSSVRNRIKYVHGGEVKRGMGGLHGNKGALVVRLVMDDSSICFINCHLAAGQTQTMHRNNDIAAILEAEVLPSYPLNQTSLAQHSDVFPSGGDGSMIQDHEICILNGDLNYRIDTMGRDTVIKHVAANNLSRLLERDQLLLSKKKNPSFRLRSFQESPITFAPTYKYNPRSDEYDTSEKRRAPAWCDRILYRGLGKVKMEEYRRWEVRVSDHRPVSGRLRMRIKSVKDAGRREEAAAACRKEFEDLRRRITKAIQ
ncbi:MAG: hypothetical protein FE78DRAFT_158153 [Acidomyces sp. 'richmondensis']|nr:MAG: hypothetical protein FE78DRAFT_158153 [Acidomyces sp. 'richmondensis']